MKTRLKTLPRNKQKIEVEKLLENKNFRNSQNYTFSKKLQKKYYVFFQKPENNNKYVIINFENEKLERKSSFLIFFLMIFLFFIIPLSIIFLITDDKSGFYILLNVLKTLITIIFIFIFIFIFFIKSLGKKINYIIYFDRKYLIIKRINYA